MPTYMVQASYTSPAWNKLVQRPENRMEALQPVVEKLNLDFDRYMSVHREAALHNNLADLLHSAGRTEAAGVTKLIVYRHFDTKEDLYRTILERVFHRMGEELEAGLSQPDLRGVGARTILKVAREDPDGFVLLWRHAAREPQFADYAHDQRELAVAATELVGHHPPRHRQHRLDVDVLPDVIDDPAEGFLEHRVLFEFGLEGTAVAAPLFAQLFHQGKVLFDLRLGHLAFEE